MTSNAVSFALQFILFWCTATAWTLTKTLESKLDGTYTRMLRAVLNISWRHHPTKLQLYGHIPPISTILRERRMRFAGHCWRAKQELASDLLLWAPRYGKTRVGRPAITYIDQLSRDTGCLPEDLATLMQDRNGWRDRLNVRASSTRWWWNFIWGSVVLFLKFWASVGVQYIIKFQHDPFKGWLNLRK